jgi:hypothetical protein
VNEKDHWDWKNHDESSQSTTPFNFNNEEDNEAVTTTPIQNITAEVRRSDRNRIPNRNLVDFDVIPDSLINNDGDLVHLALFVDTEPLSYTTTAKSEVWRKAMEEEI